MKDIVERLRERSGQYDEYDWHSELELEAALEIEKLRRLLKKPPYIDSGVAQK